MAGHGVIMSLRVRGWWKKATRQQEIAASMPDCLVGSVFAMRGWGAYRDLADADEEHAMAWIKTIADDEAREALKDLFAAAYERAGRVFNIVRIMSLSPLTLRSSLGFYQTTMMGRSTLSRGLRELLATVFSEADTCSRDKTAWQ